MQLLSHVTAPRLQALEGDRPIVPDERAGCTLHVELRLADSRDVALKKLGLAAVAPGEAHPQLVKIRHVVPDALVPVRLHRPGGAAEELEYPVDVV